MEDVKKDAVSARLLLAKARLLLAKMNFSRFPAGSPKGGQFAPKGTSGQGHADGGEKPPAKWSAMGGGSNTFHESGWAGSGMWAKPKTPPPGAKPHPQAGDKGETIHINYPSKASHPSTWSDAGKTATFTPGGNTPGTLNGVAFKSWKPPKDGWSKVAGTNEALDKSIPFEPHPTKKTGAGVIIMEPDGRVWLTKPTNSFGGYEHTFPKGTAESGLTLQQNAIKEAYEETGLKVKIVGVLGDYERDTSKARFYIARRVGGTPKDMGWESQAMRLAPKAQAMQLLNKAHDKAILDDFFHEFSKAAGAPAPAKGGSWQHQERWPAGSALGGQWKPMGGDGLTSPPTIAGGLSGKNPIYQKAVNSMHAAMQKNDVHTVSGVLDKYKQKAMQFAAGLKGNSHIKYGAAVHQYGVQLLKDKAALIGAGATAAKITGPEKLDGYKLVQAKPGGSNPGAIYTDAKGEKWLVKGNKQLQVGNVTQQVSDDRAKNEVLAAKLLQAAGAGAPEMKLVDLGKEHGGGLGVASKWETNANAFQPGSMNHKVAIQQDYAAHAWLANYDVLGMGYDNVMIKPDGKATNIDPGGALLFRAQGMPKGAAHGVKDGVLDKTAPEFESMRKTTGEQKAVFGSMTAGQLVTSANKLSQVSDETIKKLVQTYGPGDDKAKAALAQNLIDRKNAIIAKADALKPEVVGGLPAAQGINAAKQEAVVPKPAKQPASAAPHTPAPATAMPAKPQFVESTKTAKKWYESLVSDAEKLHAAGDLAGLEKLKLNPKTGAPLWKDTTTNGKMMESYHAALVESLKGKNAQATMQAAEAADKAISQKVDAPAPGTMKEASKAAMPHFDGYKLPATNSNALSHNPKVDQIAKLATAGDVKGLLALNYGTNTYGKKQAQLANEALAALGSEHKVAAGQKKNTHSALYGGSTQQQVRQAAAVTQKPMPTPHPATKGGKPDMSKLDMKGANIPPKPLFDKSSKAHVNQQNNALANVVQAKFLSGNYQDLAAMHFDVLDKETGKVIGQKHMSEHPAKDLKAFYDASLAVMREVAYPPKPLKLMEASSVKSLADIDASFGGKKFGTTVNKVGSNEKLGFWIALGKVSDAQRFKPKKTMAVSTADQAKAYEDYKTKTKSNPLAKTFINGIQASGSYNDLFRDGKTHDHAGNKLSDVAKAALDYAQEKPEGTTIHRWQHMTDDMINKIKQAGEGTVFQASGSMCTSMSATATSHFGPHRVNIVYAKGAKAVDSFGSGGYSSEKEVTTLPNARFMVLDAKEVPNDNKHFGSKKTRMEITVLMLPPGDLGLGHK